MLTAIQRQDTTAAAEDYLDGGGAAHGGMLTGIGPLLRCSPTDPSVAISRKILIWYLSDCPLLGGPFSFPEPVFVSAPLGSDQSSTAGSESFRQAYPYTAGMGCAASWNSREAESILLEF